MCKILSTLYGLAFIRNLESAAVENISGKAIYMPNKKIYSVPWVTQVASKIYIIVPYLNTRWYRWSTGIPIVHIKTLATTIYVNKCYNRLFEKVPSSSILFRPLILIVKGELIVIFLRVHKLNFKNPQNLQVDLLTDFAYM